MALFGNSWPQKEPLDPFDKNTWSDIEKLYFERVDDFFERDVGEQFTNGNAAHAVYLITKFFQNAKREVRIFSGRLTRKASNGVQIYANPNLVKAVGGFLKRGGELKIVLQEDLDGTIEEHPLVRDCLNLKKFHLVRANDDSIAFLREQAFLHHMMVMDEKAWRIETKTRLDHQGELKRVEALVSVSHPAGAASLKNLFDVVLFANGESLIPA